MIFIRSIAFNILFYAAFIVLMVIGSPCLLVSHRWSMVVVRFWAKVSVKLLDLVCGTKIEFRNLDLVPKGASIIAVKHQSFLETFALITVLDDFAYILKKELLAIPFFGWYLRATGQISVDRGRKGAAIAQLQRDVATKLAAGRQIVIFPEGTRRPVGVAACYKTGISALCGVAGVPCTPVALNTGLFWPRRSFLKHPGTVVIEFLPSIPPNLPKADFMRRLQNAIEPATTALVAGALAKSPNLRQFVDEEAADEATTAKNSPATA